MSTASTARWDRDPEVVLVVSVDTECDKVERWAPRWPLTFASVTEGIVEKLHPVCEQYGMRPTYLLSPEVVRDHECVAALLRLRNAELGSHLHIEHMDPGVDPRGAAPGYFQCQHPASEELDQMQQLTELFRDRFGAQPMSFRAGRFGAGANTVRCLETLGYRYDSSVTPHMRWGRNPGEMDFTRSPEQPYVPSQANIATWGRSSIVELPVSIVSSKLGDWLRSRVLLEHGQNVVKRTFRKALAPLWLRPTISDPSVMMHVCTSLVERHGNQPVVVLTMLLHAGELVAGASPYSATEAQAETIFKRLETILAELAQRGVRGATMAEAAELVVPALAAGRAA
jgi:hypothetical protein